MKWTRMSIGEAISGDSVKNIATVMQDHLADLPGVIGHSILIEEGGRMVILITDWPTRDECLAYHGSRSYRQFVTATQHLLVGNYVVKLFQNRSELPKVTGISGTS